MQASFAAPLPRCPRAIAERHGLARRPEPRLKRTGARNLCLRCERTGRGHGARRRATGIPPRRARARGRCRRPPRRVAVAPGLAAAPRRPAQAASRPARARARGHARRLGRDRVERRPAPCDGQRPPGLLRLGQPAAFARRRRRFAGGGRDEPERRRRRPRRCPPRARRGALAGRAHRLSARAGRRPAHERRVRRDDRLLRGRSRPCAGGCWPQRASRRPRRCPGARRLRAGRGP